MYMHAHDVDVHVPDIKRTGPHGGATDAHFGANRGTALPVPLYEPQLRVSVTVSVINGSVPLGLVPSITVPTSVVFQSVVASGTAPKGRL